MNQKEFVIARDLETNEILYLICKADDKLYSPLPSDLTKEAIKKLDLRWIDTAEGMPHGAVESLAFKKYLEDNDLTHKPIYSSLCKHIEDALKHYQENSEIAQG